MCHAHTWEYWGCVAGEGAFFEHPALAQGVFFELPELAQGAFLSCQLWEPDLACILLISQAIISRISSSPFLVSEHIASKLHKQILKSLRRLFKHTVYWQ